MLRAGISIFVYLGSAALARRLPDRVSRRVARFVGLVAYGLMPKTRRLVERNMKRATSSEAVSKRRVRLAFASYSQYWIESFRTADYTVEHFANNLRCEGRHFVDSAVEAGRGAILALPHTGNWDYGGAWLARDGYQISVVAEVLEPRRIFELFVSQREGAGIKVIPFDHSAGRATIDALRENRLLGLMSDRDLGHSGVDVTFFGETTSLPAGPATLALRTGAALIPTVSYMEPDGSHFAWFRPPIDLTRKGTLRQDIARITQDLAYELEVLIRARPEQWHMFQPNWPSDRGASPLVVAPETALDPEIVEESS